MNIEIKTLLKVLSKMLGTDIHQADYQTKQLHGGTLGDVQLVTGKAVAVNGNQFSYRVVLKIQKKWERFGDPGSWRREYDLYTSALGTFFTDSFRWPECYHTEMSKTGNEIMIWMEYIEGISGLNLSGEMYERAAEELGRFQGKLYAEQPAFLQKMTNLSNVSYMKNCYLHYRSWNVVYDYIRSANCNIPKHLCKMLIGIDENAEDILNRLENLPIVFCHRDFWVANIFYADGKIVLLDWDTAGWGYMGEDLASLIADEANVDYMVEYFQKCIPAYYKGFSEYSDVSQLSEPCVAELILLMFGYRLVEWYINSESLDEKTLQLNTLQKIYEIFMQ
ncbi:aminoglycoside phosphotransferase family protein [Anaerocolumna sp. AGMB13025]|uniref:aminoglycoside phosphotransferase family protein n=1 Tax=Anaerocolumna sp. AGMB13025 TaxID=3039116 RepID=UPI00241ED0BB|nr:aminoglycoside phosphotransferase family protein [Anaerocolumna sp. AGMB13025]WFR54787.1 aminoglycoside phosphotransferase family protein [Anaerocolumna sp. AGMB13025]